MAYKYQPIKDEMFVSDDEAVSNQIFLKAHCVTLASVNYADAQELDEADADDGDTILGLVEGESGKTNGTAAPAATKTEAKSGKASKVKQVNKILSIWQLAKFCHR